MKNNFDRFINMLLVLILTKNNNLIRGKTIIQGLEIISCLMVMNMALWATLIKQRAYAQVRILPRTR